MSFTKKEKLTNGETTVKVRKETLHQLKIVKAEKDLKTISDAIDFVLSQIGSLASDKYKIKEVK